MNTVHAGRNVLGQKSVRDEWGYTDKEVSLGKQQGIFRISGVNQGY